jgi:formate-nitrite transporter family protein
MNSPGIPEPFKPHRIIFEQETAQAVEELSRPALGLLGSGSIAGIGIGVGVFAAAAIASHAGGELPSLSLRLLSAGGLAVGFVIAIMGRTDVFTEYTTIAILPVLTGRAPLSALVRLWAWVYLANLIGATAFAVLTAQLAPELLLFGRDAAAALVRPLTGHPAWVVIGSAFIAGWLMGLLSWLITAGRDTISQIFFIWSITGLISFAHLHHCISWTAEGTLALLLGATPLAEVARVLAWTTLGNAAGGALFAVMVRYGALLGAEEDSRRDAGRRGGSAAQHPHPQSAERSDQWVD